jgi:hypothetical protein
MILVILFWLASVAVGRWTVQQLCAALEVELKDIAEELQRTIAWLKELHKREEGTA